jgi:hypothetical protein
MSHCIDGPITILPGMMTVKQKEESNESSRNVSFVCPR